MTERTCCHPKCEAPAAESVRVPLCPPHARRVYQDVSEMLAHATHAQLAEAARPPKIAARPLRGRQSGWVYFVMVGDLLKIGFSMNPKTRYRDLGVTKVLGTFPGTMRDEGDMLARFGPWRERGEYFRPEPECLELVHAVLSVRA